MKYALVIFYIFSSILSYSQPIVNSTNVLPIGSVGLIKGHPINTVDLSTGSNITWNNNFLGAFNAIGTFSVLNPSSTPTFSLFSSSNYCIGFSYGSVLGFNYYINNSSFFDLIGKEQNTGSSSSDDYSLNTKRELVYPITYLSTHIDTFFSSTSSSILTLTSTCTGYGSMNIDGKTYNNVIRIDCNYSNSVVEQTWYNVSPFYPLLYRATNNATFLGQMSLLYLDVSSFAGINEINNKQSKIYCFPNPANETLYIRTKEMVNLILINCLGEIVKTINANSTLTIVDVSDLNSGVYYLKGSGNESAFHQKVMVVR